jgi:hypothetical protein
MQGSEFQHYFEKFPELQKHFIGVFSIDTLPKTLKQRTFCICNTDTKNGIGKHWLCFVKTDKSSVECFDSLGISSEKKKLLSNFCHFNAKYVTFNETQFQRNDSSTCGLFCVYFLLERFVQIYKMSIKNVIF